MISDKLMMLQSKLNMAKYRNKMAIKLLINSGSYIYAWLHTGIMLYALVVITPLYSAF